ncbi:MAG: ankyrin repeat domain-containing protein [Saprospiraceae bacterium]
MKTLKINSIKMMISGSLLIILLASACTQADKKPTTNNNTEIKKTGDKPDVDIHTAIITGNLEVVKQHIKAGTDINQKEVMSGSTPIISAATFNKPEIAEVLIKANANLSLKNNDGSTALHSAAFFGRIEIVQMLIDAKADKTIRNNFGATPKEAVMGDFNEMKPIYEMLKLQLEPIGFVLDMNELEKARPVIAMMLQ